MGLLTAGQPLTWDETVKYQEFVKKWGVQQFISLYNKLNLIQCETLMWGDEIEYNVLKFDHENKTVRLRPIAEKLLKILQVPENEGQENLDSLWRPEYGSYCIEGIPGQPYDGKLEELLMVEDNMRLRRNKINELLDLEGGEAVLSMSIFPRLGCFPFTEPPCRADPKSSFTRSLFWPSEGTYLGHPRFKTLSTNIRQRRKEKVCINVPIYKDVKTKTGILEDLSEYGDDGTSQANVLPDHIYMDAMGFGMGLSCLQVTFQARNMREAKSLYDQLAPLCPIFLALTASSPIHRGYLADTDCRWNIISASVDDRTRGERGLEPLKEGERLIPKSRYDSISNYLSECASKLPQYNDIELVYDEDVYKKLIEGGATDLMAQHIAHLFIRDTISLFGEKVMNEPTVDDTDHFENIQSTNWQTMRFKPPPPNSNIGWRVEFRPCELQFTDFENAAVVCFIVLLTRVILSRRYNILVPISRVDENMQRAQKRDAVTNEKFYFRSDIHTMDCKVQPQIREMTIDQIVNGDETHKGLLGMVIEHVQSLESVDRSTRNVVCTYLKFIGERASGNLKTNARFMRDYISTHSDYQRDSVVSEITQYEMLNEIHKISDHSQNYYPKELYGKFPYIKECKEDCCLHGWIKKKDSCEM